MQSIDVAYRRVLLSLPKDTAIDLYVLGSGPGPGKIGNASKPPQPKVSTQSGISQQTPQCALKRSDIGSRKQESRPPCDLR